MTDVDAGDECVDTDQVLLRTRWYKDIPGAGKIDVELDVVDKACPHGKRRRGRGRYNSDFYNEFLLMIRINLFVYK